MRPSTSVRRGVPRLAATFARDVVQGLSARRKFLLPKYFYDARGSELFERITELEEYYLTRAEREILEKHGAEIAAAIGEQATVVELGPGSAQKTRLLLGPVARTGGCYVAVDVSGTALDMTTHELRASVPDLVVRAVLADYFAEDLGPRLAAPGGRRAILLMGSNMGNAAPAERQRLLRRLRRLLSAGDLFVLGVDLVKDEATLLRAYDDAAGVTAAFNLNLLARINRELGGHFVLDRFGHRARFNRRASRIEMHIESLAEQRVEVASLGRSFRFRRGETIHTENSYKFTDVQVRSLAARTGFTRRRVFTDARGAFAVFLLEAGAR